METSRGPHPLLPPQAKYFHRPEFFSLLIYRKTAILKRAENAEGITKRKVVTFYIYSFVQSLSCVRLFVIQWTISPELLCSWYSPAKNIEVVSISSAKASSQPRDWTHVPCIGRQILYHWATWEALRPPFYHSALVFHKLFCHNLSEVLEPLELILRFIQSSLVAQLVKNPSAMQETLVWFLGQEYPLEKGKATHSSILAW